MTKQFDNVLETILDIFLGMIMIVGATWIWYLFDETGLPLKNIAIIAILVYIFVVITIKLTSKKSNKK